MGELGDGLGLALEAGEPLGVAGHLLGQHLDRHLAVERRVSRAIDHTHPALAQEGDNFIAPQTVSRLHMHFSAPFLSCVTSIMSTHRRKLKPQE